MNLHSFCIVFVLHYLCSHEEDTFFTRILRYGQLSDGEGIERGIRGDGGSADSRLTIASLEGVECNTFYYRQRAARLAYRQQLRSVPCPNVGSYSWHPCLAGQSVFHDDGVSEGAHR